MLGRWRLYVDGSRRLHRTHARFDCRLSVRCRLLWSRIPKSYRRGILYSDLWESYQKVLPDDRHRAVGKSEGQTSHVERWNCTLRQRLGRFVRKTLSFSKSEAMHEVCLLLFLQDYNLNCLNNTR
jgi:insertion element IS1 protein InsB